MSPGKCPEPADMACDEDVSKVLKLVEARYTDVPKVRKLVHGCSEGVIQLASNNVHGCRHTCVPVKE